MFREKVIRAETKDIGEGRVHAIVSTESEDRDGDIIRQSGWKLGDFQRHPVLLASHDYRSLRSQIGEWESMEVKDGNLQGVARYYVGQGNEDADWGHKLAVQGKAAYSVGFIPLEFEEREGEPEKGLDFPTFEFTSQELLEVSHVTIPSNRDALQLMAKAAGMHPVIDEIVREQLGDGDRKQQSVNSAEARFDAAREDFDLMFEALWAELVGEIEEENTNGAGAAIAQGIAESVREVTA